MASLVSGTLLLMLLLQGWPVQARSLIRLFIDRLCKALCLSASEH